MEMDTIDDKIDKGIYASPTQFIDDVLLMLNNCRLYNGPDSEYTETADELEGKNFKTQISFLESRDFLDFYFPKKSLIQNP